MRNIKEIKQDVIDYLFDEYPDEYKSGKFTAEIIDAIVDDIIRNSDEEDPLTRLYESDYNGDWVLGFLDDEHHNYICF